ncbi:MOSC domain-containing protein [uncultured Paraglaciecola sp.]|uniref:MOSC domain-containing protein n=1 Tax=uncultured Paraglaciecola sp. TaxID=1765024 RepID=UPI0025992E6C|nr:MOSC domain-containing protein [uncultured Paraglaciecola sp.]
MKVIGLYKAQLKRIGPKSELTGIYKYPTNTATVDKLGIVGDIQVDKRYHGGPERALHQYSLSSYEKIIKAYPLLYRKAKIGSMGENISVGTMNESNVCIGDTYEIGKVVVQVSGPRMPCFKISEKFSTPGLDKFIAKHGIHGWYYRILTEGSFAIDDQVTLVSRPNPTLTIADFLKLARGKTAPKDALQNASKAEGLDPEWQETLQRKATNS